MKDEYGNQYAEFDFKDHPAKPRIKVEIDYQVTIFWQSLEPGNCEGSLPVEFTQPELYIESANPQILTSSQTFSKGKENVCDQVHAFYDDVGDELIYGYNQKVWGAQAALGTKGANCTDYSFLMIALSRASSIPARCYEGIRYRENQSEGIAQAKHA